MASSDSPHPITRMLHAVQDGDPRAAEELLPAMYGELRDLARVMMRRERPGQTLQATALVHEAYMRVLGSQDPGWDGRGHFFAAAAEAMRRVLINQARRKKRLKHGGEFARQDLEDVELPVDGPGEDVLAVDEALQALEEADPRARQLVNLRYFAGFTTAETAEAMGVSVSTVEREWRFVRAWLRDRIGGAGDAAGDS